MPFREASVESVADAYLELLSARGVEYFFGNGGTDFGPIAEAYVKRTANEQPVPKPITVPHEITGTAMALGHAMVSGQPQVVMVHTVPGTANALGTIITASRSNIPVFFTAGRTPLTEGPGVKGARSNTIQWAQESRDQGSMVREWVKWDYELRNESDLEAIVDRGMAICQTEPKGPVYLTLPREVLAEERESIRYSDRPRMTPAVSAPSPEAIQKAASLLAGAQNPLVITNALGRDPSAVQPLVELAEKLNLPVFDAPGHFLNFPKAHRLYQPQGVSLHLQDADLILVIESDSPWIPSLVDITADTTVIAMGNDPLFSSIPVRSFPADLTLQGSPRLGIESLIEELDSMSIEAAAIEQRGARWQAERQAALDDLDNRAQDGRGKTPLDKAWVSHCLEQARHENMIVVNELGLDAAHFRQTLPGSYFGSPSPGALGWGHGAALGAKLAAPEKTVVACLGDGSYMFDVPEAGHWIARNSNLPILTIVWDNAKWAAVSTTTRALYPDGWAAKNDQFPFSDLGPSLDFELICQSAGGYAERVEDAEDVPNALQRALHSVEMEGRQALLHMVSH